jgi:hypothetical protein
VGRIIVRVFFGKTEWDEICGPMAGAVDELVRSVKFRTALALSSALVATCNVVFDFEAFDVRNSPCSEWRSSVRRSHDVVPTGQRGRQGYDSECPR